MRENNDQESGLEVTPIDLPPGCVDLRVPRVLSCDLVCAEVRCGSLQVGHSNGRNTQQHFCN
jgi:hypothetical protein